MAQKLKHIKLPNFKLKSGKVQDISVSYQIFGRALHTAPIILVNHALTGNSSVNEWWSQLLGSDKAIDTNKFTVIALDIPGNGFDENIDHLIFNYQDWTLEDVAMAFVAALKQLKICYIHTGVGGSIGGSLLWEMTVIYPELFGTIIPIAADWKASDWIIANCHIQDRILTHSSQPLEDARQHAMTFYRTPQSFRKKFNREKEAGFKVINWLNYHGLQLKERFTLPAYRLLNHLLSTANAARNYNDNILKAVASSETKIRLIAINSDGFFTAQEDRETYELLRNYRDIEYHEIDSIHGHDAFLIEHDQVTKLLKEQINDTVTHFEIKECN
jgi:homoserine O-acetyltransferase